ncbi:MAG: YihA family ribosome biogenesis GTP-binding protein [Firmicutes bacterium]|uniref:Probable GTP-binding protein EngB n=1 Tax=Candidatus Gallilactobacillus intestinavium TaxID=2840838 RepID=A0A9D9E5W0_9LACO|nr:YihA family ribosome biogenesis GTP-binding protein [Candidatus Gallilactobacillus intestinavium]
MRKIKNINLLISAVQEKQYPKHDLPEIAFLGRSNVGKSSLINSLVNRKSLAHTSSKPGKTQTLNFYNINNDFCLVDVPGYGFAQVSKKDQERFGQMVENYLVNRDNLRGVVLLIDSRHKPTDDDKLMYNYIKYYHLPILIIATKSDKITRSKWNACKSLIKQTLNLDEEDGYVQYSALKKMGIDDVWQWIDKLLEE